MKNIVIKLLLFYAAIIVLASVWRLIVMPYQARVDFRSCVKAIPVNNWKDSGLSEIDYALRASQICAYSADWN